MKKSEAPENLTYQRILRVAVSVDREWLTADFTELEVVGWGELQEEIESTLSSFDNHGGFGGPYLRFVEWDGDPEVKDEEK